MKLDKIKEIFGLMIWTMLIFVAKYIEVSNGDGGFIVKSVFAAWGALVAGMGAAQLGLQGLVKGPFARRKNRAEWRERHAGEDAQNTKRQLNRWKSMYNNLSMSNPYLNMENTMEDLTVNQQQYQFERQAFQQSQKNILGTMRQGVGASGVASLAQSLVRQGERSEQQLAAGIAQQESRNRTLALQQRERLQRLEREGRRIPMDFRTQQVGAMMGMAQEQYTTDKDLELQYRGLWGKQATARIQSNSSMMASLLGSMRSAGAAASSQQPLSGPTEGW